ncbi:MAG: DUF975 family protein [Clostridia bacterium]|jgi:uncharacterized membrane protein|nr:DUF975 family protein [Clostridia bacterium]
MTSSEIRSTARQSLTNKWGKAALIAFCYFLIEFLINFMISGAKGSLPLLSSLLSIGNTVISVPLAYGFLISFMKLKRGEEVNAFDFFADGFSNFGRAWGITWGIIKKLLVPIIIIIVLYIVLIASSVSLIAFSSTLFKSYSASASITAGFLSIICSIGLIALYIWIAIKSLFYVLVYQVAYDNPNLSSKEVVEESERLMTGNRGKYFVLQLSFIGWAILACLTLGIGMFWLTPYITVATICFYEALSGKSDTTIEVDSEEIK